MGSVVRLNALAEVIKKYEEILTNKPSLYEDLEKIPCFKKTFTFSICSGLGAGLACFLFTSRIKRSSDVAVATFTVATIAKWIHCRYYWTKEHFSSTKFQNTLPQAILKEGSTKPTDPAR